MITIEAFVRIKTATTLTEKSDLFFGSDCYDFRQFVLLEMSDQAELEILTSY